MLPHLVTAPRQGAQSPLLGRTWAFITRRVLEINVALASCRARGPLVTSVTFQSKTGENNSLQSCGKMADTSSAVKECLVIGGEGSGKSILIRRMKELQQSASSSSTSSSIYEAFNPSTQPTVGVDLIDVEWKGRGVKLRELGSAISSRWSAYFKEANMVVYLVDTADIRQWSNALIQLYDMTSYKEEWTGKDLLIVMTKTDISAVAQQSACLSFLKLPNPELHKIWRRVKIIFGSCLENELATAVLEWLVTTDTK